MMFDIARKVDRQKDLRNKRRALRGLFLWISLSLLFGSAGQGAAEAANTENRPVASGGTGSRFAIADFDGDRRPDLARVQAGAASDASGTADYSIQLQLTAAGPESIQFLAPAGGLEIEARDVNGDHAIDLVLTTAWFKHPVAIFINDGHGSFSRAEPAAFPGAFSESRTNWLSTTILATDVAGVPTQSSASICADQQHSPHERSPARFVPLCNPGFQVSPFLVSQAGRAPPFELPHL
jgi:hypothetical protein